ncbi:MAG: ATP-binding cassette domain-containing protein, partial [Thermoleophilia bacterium]|nr:ATP-binding cassette domain-containing protein [Thermoleophilia bacterium]
MSEAAAGRAEEQGAQPTDRDAFAALEGREADIHLEKVTKRFGEMTAVDGLTLSIERGAFYAMLGPSGCGKTTTLRMIGGFEDPTEGKVYLGGDEVTNHPPYKRDVNTVFQSYALFPHLSVERNVGFGLERKKVSKSEVKQRVG